jgi:hypothetical protein
MSDFRYHNDQIYIPDFRKTLKEPAKTPDATDDHKRREEEIRNERTRLDAVLNLGSFELGEVDLIIASPELRAQVGAISLNNVSEKEGE